MLRVIYLTRILSHTFKSAVDVSRWRDSLMRAERNITDRLHSVESAAEFLGFVSPSTVRSWLTQGKLTRIKVGRLTRVRESELMALIKPEKKGQAK
jgi:excisionase family DNA binding protein